VINNHHDPDRPLVRIGDLANASGLSTRALHHYEDIGLVAPATRTAAGHRLYGPESVERVYRINRLRRLGLSLDQIGRALDDPAWDLATFLTNHADALDTELDRIGTLRTLVGAVIADLDHRRDPTDDLLEVLTEMERSDRGLRRPISILVYADLPAAHEFLVEVFGLTPGDITTLEDGTTVHAEVYAGPLVIWLHPETADYRLASPANQPGSTSMMAVIVDDVDEHHRLVKAKGGDIVYPPTDQPYGYREYGARDLEGHLWSFMREDPTLAATP